MKCIACGSDSLVEGALVDMKGCKMSYFKLAETPNWKSSIFGTGIREVRAFGCVSCGLLQHIVDFKEEDLLNYRQFDGEQPNFLDRMKEESEC